jgi:hypothetical protein
MRGTALKKLFGSKSPESDFISWKAAQTEVCQMRKPCSEILEQINEHLVMSHLLIPNGPNHPLSEGDKIEILHHHTNGLGPVEIGARFHRSESTIRSFLKS